MAWARVALLLAAAEPAKPNLEALAKQLAFVPKPEPMKNTQQPAVVSYPPEPEENDAAQESDIANIPKMIFWQVTKITHFKEAENEIPASLLSKEIAAQFNPQQKGSFVFEKPTPLATLTQLTPLLINSLGRKVGGRHLDNRKIMRCISQGKPLKKLFYQAESKWPLQLTILLDKHSELYPYWHDYDEIVRQLQIQLGKANVQLITVHERNLADFAAKNTAIHPALLILSDLHDYSNHHRYWAWQEALEVLLKQASQILTLSSAVQSPQKDRFPRKLRINSLKPVQGFSRHAKKHGFNIPVSDPQIEAALAMISPLALVDNGLLRKLRVRFHWGKAALEGEIWNDKRIVPSVLGVRLQTVELEKYRNEFAKLSERTQQRYWALVEAHHKNAYPGLHNLEAISKVALNNSLVPEPLQTTAYLQSLLAHYHQNTENNSSAQLKAQLKSIINFAPAMAAESSEVLAVLLHQCYALAYQDEIQRGKWRQSVPLWLNPHAVPMLNALPAEQHQAYSLHASGVSGEAIVQRSSRQKITTLLTLPTANAQPVTWQSEGRPQRIPIDQGQRLSLKENQIATLKTANKLWQVKGIARPDFAQNIGQDQQGLFIETHLNKPACRYVWLPAEESVDQHTLAGGWIHQRILTDGIKRDVYGIYKDVHINMVTQRFRYIAPGIFMMGSPENEPRREPWGQETQHLVTLSQGFWLADSVVTQGLYQAVMGKNPSEFTGDRNRPVENISWDDAQQFIEKINTLNALLFAQIPSEAQWEYACRAGTNTPFSFGYNIMTEQSNFDGNLPYAQSRQGENRKKTVVVKSLPANLWGLYEMHGNVWEWCIDSYQEDLGRLAIIDPVGDSGIYRVVRGGSWFNSGGYARSAIRRRFKPERRNSIIGFRFALGL